MEAAPSTTEGTERAAAVDLSGLHSLWVRWTDVRPTHVQSNVDALPIPLIDIHLHRFCDLFPTSASDPTLDDVDFRFLTGVPRTILRLTPLFVLLVTLGLGLYGEVSPDVEGLRALLPAMPPWLWLALVAAGALWSALVLLAQRVGLVEVRELARVVAVWGLIGGLLLGALVAAVLVLTAPDPTALGPNVVFVSGYLLMLLLGGLLVYDGMLRTETLIDKLPEVNRSIIENETTYRQWQSDLQESLSADVRGVPVSHLFSLLFVAQFAAVWLAQSGPQNLDSAVVLVVNLVADFVLVVVAFRFLILVKYVHLLMTDQYAPRGGDQTRIIRYEPFHYDRHGGFQDFGRFALRVNVLLLAGGLYTVFRLYVQGLRVLPPAGLVGFATPVDLLLWLGSFVLPVLAYAVAAGAWVYYSFWAMHRKMVMDKLVLSAGSQGRRGAGASTPRVGDSIDDFEGGPDWSALNTAPEWPVNSRYIASLVSANAVPLLLPLVNFLG